MLLDRAHDSWIAVADVDAHQLTVEVEIALAFRRPEIGALGARDGDRIHGALNGPLENRVTLGEGDDVGTVHIVKTISKS